MKVSQSNFSPWLSRRLNINVNKDCAYGRAYGRAYCRSYGRAYCRAYGRGRIGFCMDSLDYVLERGVLIKVTRLKVKLIT
jgi:hypothetical protein